MARPCNCDRQEPFLSLPLLYAHQVSQVSVVSPLLPVQQAPMSPRGVDPAEPSVSTTGTISRANGTRTQTFPFPLVEPAFPPWPLPPHPLAPPGEQTGGTTRTPRCLGYHGLSSRRTRQPPSQARWVLPRRPASTSLAARTGPARKPASPSSSSLVGLHQQGVALHVLRFSRLDTESSFSR